MQTLILEEFYSNQQSFGSWLTPVIKTKLMPYTTTFLFQLNKKTTTLLQLQNIMSCNLKIFHTIPFLLYIIHGHF